MKSTALLFLLLTSTTLFSQTNPSSPVAICEETMQVELGYDGIAILDAETFDNDSYTLNFDSVFFKVLRLNADQSPDTNCLNFYNLDLTTEEIVRFNDQVAFCCEDLFFPSGKTVVLRVFDIDPGAGPVEPDRMENGGDLFGHFNDCHTQVIVESKEPIIICKPVTVSCQDNLDPLMNTSLYPEIYSSCGHELTYEDHSEEPCANGFTRSWNMYSTGGQHTSCDQEFTFYEFEPFDPCSFAFPESKVTHCIPDLDLLTYPNMFEEQPCSIVLNEIASIDTIPGSGDTLFTIKIQWGLIDWCIYEPNSGAGDNVDIFIDNYLDCDQLVEDGLYLYTQTITVMDSLDTFDPCSIVFPADINTDCLAVLGEFPEPSWQGAYCFPVHSELESVDTLFDFEEACYQLLMNWVVIEPTAYEPNSGAEDNLDSIAGNKLNCEELVEDGYYKYTQKIKLTDSISPEIIVEEVCKEPTYCFASEFSIMAEAVDSCAINQEVNWKYLVTEKITGDTIQYSFNYEPKPMNGIEGNKELDVLINTQIASIFIDSLWVGHYNVEWWATDDCGNKGKATQILRIVDNKPPTPFLLDVFEPEFEEGKTILRAKDFDKGACNGFCLASFDDCSPEASLLFTFSDQIPNLWTNPGDWQDQLNEYGKYFFDPVDGSISSFESYQEGEAHAWIPGENTSEMIFFEGISNCDNIIDVFVWDQFAYNSNCDFGNYDFASVLLLTDHPGAYNVRGNIKILDSETEFSGMVMYAEESAQQTISDENGVYQFSLCPGSYHLQGYSNEDNTAGLSTLDLILIQLAILGHIPFDDPYQQLSADLNGSNSISASDLFILHGLLIYDFPSIIQPSWIAISADYSTSSPDNTLEDLYLAQNKEITINMQDTASLMEDFYAIKKGDFNNTVGKGWEERIDDEMALVIRDTLIAAGEQYDLHVYGKNINHFTGLQFTMDFDELTLNQVVPGLLQYAGSNNFRIVDDQLLASVTQVSPEGLDIPENEILFTLNVTANSNVKFSEMLQFNDDLLRTELYTIENFDVQVHQLDLEFSGTINTTDSNNEFKLTQNLPNPFKENTVIEFYLAESKPYVLRIYDTSGSQILKRNGISKAGKNFIKIKNNELPSEGVFFYQLRTDQTSAIRKMVKLK